MQLLSSQLIGNKDLNEIALHPLVGVRSASGDVIERFGSADSSASPGAPCQLSSSPWQWEKDKKI